MWLFSHRLLRSQKSLSVTHQPHTVGVAAELPATVYPAVGKIEEQAIYRFFCAGAIPIGHGARKDLAVDSGVRTVRRDDGLEFVHGGQTPLIAQARVGLRVSKFLQITNATGTVFPLLTAAAAHPRQVSRLVVHHLTIYGESRSVRFFSALAVHSAPATKLEHNHAVPMTSAAIFVVLPLPNPDKDCSACRSYFMGFSFIYKAMR